MELIVRTVHGTADVTVEVHGHDVSVRDVITAVTGQAAPDTVRIDGRLVNAGETLDACGAVAGAVVDTVLNNQSLPGAPTIAVLRQLTGPGAGRHVALSAGHYRIGPGRRHQADELSADAADLVAFELEVDGTGVIITPPRQPSPAVSPLTLGGVAVEGPTPWSGTHLIAAGRAFRLDDFLLDARPSADGAIDGRLAHNRPPGIVDIDRTIAEAIDGAQTRGPRLWHRRTADGALRVDIGLQAQRSTRSLPAAQYELGPLVLDLTADRTVAIAGATRDRDALARSVLIDSCTRYGPADLDVVIASPPEALDGWDWAKWLPHIRSDASVDVLTNDLDMASFAERPLQRSTIVIVTADELWNTADSALRSLVIDGKTHASVVVLTADHSTAPSSATSLITLDAERPGAASLTHLQRDGTAIELLVPLIDADVAADVARHLAPLVDPDRINTAAHRTHHIPLGDIVDVDAAARRWNSALGTPDNPVAMAVGTVTGAMDDVVIGVDFALDASIAISGSRIDEAVDLAAVLTLSVASTWSPTEATLLIIDHRVGQTANPLQRLPHHGGTFSERDATSTDRLLTGLRDDLVGEQLRSTRLIIVINGLAETELAAPGLVDGLSRIAAESLGVHLVIASARPLAALSGDLRSLCVLEIAVDSYGGTPRATLRDRRRASQTPFSPYDESPAAADALTVRPFLFGRRPSALERRLERSGRAHVDRRNSVVARIAQQLDDLAEQLHCARPRPLFPIALPTRIVASDLWSTHTGDGVPLGILDTADSGSDSSSGAGPGTRADDVDWWLPGVNGSRLLIGTPRSGVRSTLEVLLVGIAERFSADDIDVIAIEPNDRRRTAVAALPHVSQVVSPAHEGAVEAALANVARTMHERANRADFRVHDHPTVLVLARDIERLTQPALAALTHLLAEGAVVGINVVACAARPDGIETTIAAAHQIVVGSLSDTDHYVQMGLERFPSIEPDVGRAQLVVSAGPIGAERTRTVQLVQLAALGAPFESVLDALTTSFEDVT